MPAPESLRDDLARRLATAQSEWRAPSVVASVFRDGETVWEGAVGLADVESSAAATVEHAYRIGSITKTFTAVTIMQLRDEGRIDLDAPIRRYLDAYPDGPTVRQALAHLSGLQREPPGEIWETMRVPTREELVRGLAEAEQVLEPGREWHYSNLAFAALGEVVARVVGSGSFERTLRERVLRPLRLDRTRMEPGGARATPYFVDPYADRVYLEPDPEVPESTGAAGWLWSTVGDLGLWADFLAAGEEDVLARASLDEMASVHTMVDRERWTVGWGLGLELFRRGDRVLVGHGGAMPGFLAAVCVQRAERTGAAVLANTSAGAHPETLALDLACTALDALQRTPAQWAPSSVPAEVEPLLGTWWTEGDRIELSFRGGRLRLELIGAPEGRNISYLEPEGTDAWRIAEGRERGELVRAVRDDKGRVVKLYVATYPATRHPSTFGEAPRAS